MGESEELTLLDAVAQSHLADAAEDDAPERHAGDFAASTLGDDDDQADPPDLNWHPDTDEGE